MRHFPTTSSSPSYFLLKNNRFMAHYKASDHVRNRISKSQNEADINIVLYHQQANYEFLLPLQNDKNTIKVIVNDQITTSPLLQNNTIINCWEEDLLSPHFNQLLFQRMYSIICVICVNPRLNKETRNPPGRRRWFRSTGRCCPVWCG